MASLQRPRTYTVVDFRRIGRLLQYFDASLLTPICIHETRFRLSDQEETPDASRKLTLTHLLEYCNVGE